MSNHLPPQEWADAKTVERIFGIKRCLLYSLLGKGKIKSTSLREPGNSRGKRLFSVVSIRALIEANVEE